MKVKRLLFIVVLTVVFAFCFQSMNTRYNPLARYSYNDQLSMEEKEKIIENMSNEDIDYMIQAKLKPEQYLKYIDMEGFHVKNTLYYEKCNEIQPASMEYILKFVNTYRSKLTYKSLSSLLTTYSYKHLEEFYNGEYTYNENAKLILNPQEINTSIGKDEIVYKYVPEGLVELKTTDLPIASLLESETIKVKAEMAEPLKQMLVALEAEVEKKYGDLILTLGYVSYYDQIKLYDEALLKYGIDLVHYYEDYPGQSEHQLGYTVKFNVAGMDEKEIEESEQVKWIEEHASEYGFVLRYPKNAESKTGKFYQPLTLRYVGNEAKEKDFDFIEFLSGDLK